MDMSINLLDQWMNKADTDHYLCKAFMMYVHFFNVQWWQDTVHKISRQYRNWAKTKMWLGWIPFKVARYLWRWYAFNLFIGYLSLACFNFAAGQPSWSCISFRFCPTSEPTRCFTTWHWSSAQQQENCISGMNALIPGDQHLIGIQL